MKKNLLVFTLFFTLLFCQKNAFCQLLNLKWGRCFGGSNNDIPELILLSPTDNTAVVVGNTASGNYDLYATNINGLADIWAVKINADGNKVWQKQYGGNYQDSACDAIYEPDNDEINVLSTIISAPVSSWTLYPVNLCGEYKTYHYEYHYLSTKKFSNTAPPVTTNTLCPNIPIADHLFTKKIRKMPNGNYIMLYTEAGYEFPNDAQLICYNSGGTLLWQNEYYGNYGPAYNSKDVVVDQHNQIYASYQNNNPTFFDIRKYKKNGTLIWTKTISNTDTGWGIFQPCMLKQLNNGNLLIGLDMGSAISNPTSYKGQIDVWLAEIDTADGNIIKERCFGSTQTEKLKSIDVAPNGDIIVGATTDSQVANNGDVIETGDEQDIWVLRINSTDFSILYQKRLNTGAGVQENNCQIVGINNNDIIGTYGSQLSQPSPLIPQPLGMSDFWVFNLSTQPAMLCPAQGQTQNLQIYIKKVQWDTQQQYASNSRAETGYGNYKNITFNLIKGNTYPLTLVPNLTTVQNAWTIGIDINNDLKFDNSDPYINKVGIGTVSTNITIPTTLSAGCYTMRVVMKQGNTYPTTLCGTIQNAEVEDYTVCIQNPKTDPQTNNADLNYLYPNPAHSFFNYTWNSTQTQKYTFKIIDIHGKTIQHTEVEAQQGYNNTQLDTQNLPQGLYLFQTTNQNNQTITQKFVKQ